ncbi:chondroitinase-B domain-containing protein [Flavivirga amylovorans]|uniref:Chondroitinase-B domain-containing protein n=1 Tax=Flavivirga amylovorans TaxID=870486 RepID=A0ABT8X689_9FLAO|nr:chondroitinase-B domain-containing protein [Flavivirga amylovorans]MDO5989213.1 chondroitinase-B domain-containing protein [Flavivirga amylovorans]
MKKFFVHVFIGVFIVSCNNDSVKSGVFVENISELEASINNAKPGNVIFLKNGIWKNVQIKFKAEGVENNPITIKAETPGKVFIEGVSNVKFGGKYLIIDGLHFRNGYSPSDAVIEFKIDKKTIGNHCTVTNCVIEDFNKMSRDDADRWIQFWGRHNTLKNCYIKGKTNRGPTIRIDLKGNEHINNYHQIVNNHFGPRPPKGGASGETIQIGDSYSSMSPSYTMVANNLFEECNGEVEIISSKTNFNEFRNNVFYKSEGSLVTRHGNYCTIDGNYFIGDGKNENIGGIRIINTGHWVTNNYFYNLKGKSFRSPLAVMNGIPKSPLNRYNQVTDVVVAYNTYINCDAPWQFGVGQNLDQKNVLPPSEIRSSRPLRTLVANNLLYNEVGDKSPIVEHDQADGVTFKSNIINNKNVEFVSYKGLEPKVFGLNKVSDHVFGATGINDVEPYQGFEFEKISNDLFGNSRKNNNIIGAIVSIKDPNILDKTKYGPSWYSDEVEAKEPKTIKVSAKDSFQSKIDEANSGDIIILNQGKYLITKPLVINKRLTIKSSNKTKTVLYYAGEENSSLFQLHPKGFLALENVYLKGTTTQQAFASLKENMYTHFGLSVTNCEISDFDFALKVYKQSFAERITFKNTSISNCENGLELSEETNDKGDYNTEYLTINSCQFTNVKQNVIDYYRGGYDESTIGGNLILTNSSFINCGAKEQNGILINTRGIVNVDISNNTFKNNPVKLVALLWGAKNNYHVNNTISNSGKILVEEHLKLKLMY